MYVILNWDDGTNIATAEIVMDNLGKVRVFKSYQEAFTFAQHQLTGHWRIVND